MLSFFNGLLNNIISYTNIIQDIQTVQAAGNTTGLYYQIARLIRITLDFEPILFTEALLMAANSAEVLPRYLGVPAEEEHKYKTGWEELIELGGVTKLVEGIYDGL